MNIRDRVKELRRVKACELRPNPKNWRTHSKAQADALRGVLAEIGFASALLTRELPDGSLMLIDGHLRAETLPETLVPVLVLDVTESEATMLLATFDTLGAMADADADKLSELLRDVSTGNDAVEKMLEDLAKEHDIGSPEDDSPADTSPQLGAMEYRVVVDCRDESHQAELLTRFEMEGLKCRALIS